MPRTCWARTSRPPSVGSSESWAPFSTASSAASHSSTSKRLEGTKIALDGSSIRWLERPMRCSMREAPLGAPTCTTRSTSPQSMPRSSVDVHTNRLQLAGDHRTFDLAPLLDREGAVVERDGETVLVNAPQVLEQHLGLAARVDEQQRSLVLLDDLVELGHGIERRVSG